MPGFNLAHDRFADGETTGQRGSGQRAGDFVADLVVLRTADDLAENSLTCVHLSDFQSVRIRVLDGFPDLGDDNFL